MSGDDRVGRVLEVTDLWFRSALPLAAIGDGLDLAHREHDSETVWEWVIGDVAGVRIDVTRDHRAPPHDTDVRVFRVDRGELSPEQRAAIVRRLFALGIDRVAHGRWRYLRGTDFEKICLGVDERDGPVPG
jgi:hypothetical protein